MSDLTEKQQKWLDEYFQCWNGAEAARRAGYSSIYQSAHDNLTNPKIRDEITLRLNLNAMSADEALSRLADMARASIEDFVQFDDSGSRVWRIDLLGAREAGKLHVLKKLSYDSEGRPHLELYDAQRALELILKAHGAFSESLDVTTKGESLNDGARITEAGRDALIAAIFKRARDRAAAESGEPQ